MSDDSGIDEVEVPGVSAPEAAAIGIALTGASRKKADAFLDRQSNYLRLQMEDLHEQRDLTLSHLRWRRFSDWMRVGWQVLFCLILAIASIALVVAIGQAIAARDLVIDPLVVPTSIADRGLSGEAAAEQILARLNAMSASTLSYTQAGGAYRDAAGNNLKVMIPQTGISVGELNQYLRSALGNETHIGGAIIRNGNSLTLTLRIGERATPSITETNGDLDKLIQRAAESIFQQDRPLRFADYLIAQGRFPEALAIVKPLSVRGPHDQRANALSDWAQILLAQGKIDEAAARWRASEMEVPGAGATYLGFLNLSLGHQEAALQELQAGLRFWTRANTAVLGRTIAATTSPNMRSDILSLQGDFRGAAAANGEVLAAETGDEPVDVNLAQRVSFLVQDHDLAAARAASDEQSEQNARDWSNVNFANAIQDWRGAARDGYLANRSMTSTSILSPYAAVVLWCDWAWAQAASGDFKSANERIAQTSPDSDICALDRGKIAFAEHHPEAAAFWFSSVERRAPNIPFADTDWGEMLLAQGQFAAAIEKLEAAHIKGPHFADPLEAWGEALVASNRSDLALAKFEEANRYAPSWGRLHLKWAEALYWAGRKEDANRQLQAAAALDMSKADRLTLAHDITKFRL